MARKIIFFINPISGTKNKVALEKKIIAHCEARGIIFQILFTNKEGNYQFLREKITQEEITDIVVCGGDGSIRPFIAALLNVEVNIGILPLGSGNGVAMSAQIPRSIDKALETIFAGATVQADAYTINGEVCAHLSGLGFDAKVAHAFAQQKNRGLNTYIREFVKAFLKTKTADFEVLLNGEWEKFNAFCICIANSNQFGNNMKIAPRASLCDGLLDIIIVQKTTKANALLLLLKHILLGKVLDIPIDKNKTFLYYQTRSIKIKNLQHALVHVDGDPAPTTEIVEAEILPAAFRLIIPSGKMV
ncbi:MAG: YegS/Rv2252/BmrU family lipid kinase [Bacteroidetes bacterium]|nr:YegS/Rv2252/BmrU family lipid kinase [Bacteroidota bacterium]